MKKNIMFLARYRFETLLLSIFAAMAGVLLALFMSNNKTIINSAAYTTKFSNETSPVPIEATTSQRVSQDEPRVTTVSQISQDGTKKITLQRIDNNDGTKTFSLSSSDGTGENVQIIFNKNLAESEEIIIPFNAWSPDNEFFFVGENRPGDERILVFRAGGGPFENDELYLDLTETFRNSSTGFNFKEATGWGGYSVIVFNTTTNEGGQGPSFWFDVPSRDVIRLSTLFL
jgi:hypothetical protein